MIGSECADWWEKRNKEYHEELEQYVLDNPGNFAIVVATSKASAADFAMTMWVDLARLGEGAASGTVKGVVQDVFRVLNFVPEAKLAQGSKTIFSRAVQLVSNLTVWRKVEGGLCAPIAIAQVLQRGGHRIGVGLAEIAEKLGKPLRAIYKQGVPWSSIEGALTELGLQFSKYDGAAYKTLQSLKTLAGSKSGPLLVAVTFTKQVGQKIERAGHAILVGKTASGVKIIDRYGMFNTLEEVERYYGLGKLSIDAQPIFSIANAVIDPSLLHLVNNGGVLACLVRQAVAIFDINLGKMSPEELDADFEKYLARKGRKVLQAPETTIVGGYTVEAVAGSPDKSTLSGIAKSEYGDFNLWPLIFDLNKDKLGNNPNRLKPGTKLLLLPIARYASAELADARRRAPSWRNYPL